MRLLETVVKLWFERCDTARHYMYDCRILFLAISSARVISRCERISNTELAPISGLVISPNCNPMDYYVWGVVEKDTKAEMVAKINAMFV